MKFEDLDRSKITMKMHAALADILSEELSLDRQEVFEALCFSIALVQEDDEGIPTSQVVFGAMKSELTSIYLASGVLLPVIAFVKAKEKCSHEEALQKVLNWIEKITLDQ